MLSAASQFVEKTECDRRITITDAPLQPKSGMYQMGLEGSFAERAIQVKLGGHEFAVEEDDRQMTIHTDLIGPLPFLFPFLLSNIGSCQLALLHACAVRLKDKGILVAGAGGSGRTGLLLRLLEQGGGLVSEDSCLLSSDGHVLSTGPRMILSCQMTRNGELKDNVSPLVRSHKLPMRVLLKLGILRTIRRLMSLRVDGPYSGALRRLSNSFQITLDVDSRDLWGNQCWIQSSFLDTILLLSARPRHPVTVREVSPEEMARRLSVVNRLELKAYLELIQIHRFARPHMGVLLADEFTAFEEIISAGVKRATCLVLSGPKAMIQKRALELVGKEDETVKVGGLA